MELVNKLSFEELQCLIAEERIHPFLLSPDDWAQCFQFDKPIVIHIVLDDARIERLKRGEQLFTDTGVVISYESKEATQARYYKD